MKVFFILAAVLISGAVASAGDYQRELILQPGEKWWGGRLIDATAMPFGADHDVRRSLHAAEHREGNQAQPLLISSAGRYVWNEEPFAFEFVEGKLRLGQAATDWQTGSGATATLADGFRAASQRFFPPSGKMPAPLLFTAPQFNTWIELLYDQRQERILAYAHALIARGYPPGVLMIDDNWQEDYGTWRFSARRFPDPKGMMRELHALGFKVMVWVCPFVSADSENYRLLQKQGLLLLEKSAGASSDSPASSARPAIIRWWNGASAVLDLSNPATRAWFKNELGSLMKEWGVDGFKFDAGDSVFYEPGQPGIEFVSHAPRTPEGHTVDFAGIGLDYPFNEYRACWKLGGQALAQRLRDKDHTWDALRELIPGMITEGLMGYAFTCPDMIGGGLSSAFEDPAKFDPELVVRSAQVHALMPMMQFSVAPWRVLPPELSDLCLAAARLHVKFGPQILKLAERSAKSGEPIVRPLAWQWPHRDYETIRDQFMLGDDVMVAPVVTKGAQTRPVVFPPGKWLGDDGTVVEGPARREVATPLARLPYYTLQAPGTN